MSSTNGNEKRGILARLLPVGKSAHDTYHPVLLDKKQFQWALDRERARSERSESEFVLVRMRLAKSNGHASKNGRSDNGHRNGNGHHNGNGNGPRNGLLAQLGEVIGERMRQSDFAGLCDGGIGLVLPNMPEETVASLVQDIERLFHDRVEERYGNEKHAPSIRCEIFYSAN